MNTQMREPCARLAAWFVRRNPTYLLSAAAMAVAVRLLLGNQTRPAGDLLVILMTLGVLEAYEWAVCAVIVMLHRRRRAPEDAPSLLLVAALFWTGPIAATIEMTAWRPDVGLAVAAGAGALAVAQLRIAQRLLGLELRPATQAASLAAVLILVIAQPLVRTSDDAVGTNELWLYAAWWVLAGAALITLVDRRAVRTGRDLLFVAFTACAAALHLAGMNHAFFCHARWFYASPLLIAGFVIAMEFLCAERRPRPGLLAALATLPAVAIALASEGFAGSVPAHMLPLPLREPMILASFAAAMAYGLGFVRLRAVTLLHLAVATVAWAALLITHPRAPYAGVTRETLAALLYVGVAYLMLIGLIRRSRTERVAAAVVNLAAMALLIWERTPADGLILWLAAGWSALIAIHIASRRPPLLIRLVPIAAILLVSWAYHFGPMLTLGIRVHAVLMAAGLFAAGMAWPWTRYRAVACVLAIVYVGHGLWRWAASTSIPPAFAIIAVSFALLFGGALISWHKRRIIAALDRPAPDDP